MARRKAPENETQQEMEVRKAREEISNHATRSEKVSWERQYGNMQKLLVEKLQPIEDQILELIGKKNEVFDEIVVLRDELVRDCIHPFEHVVLTTHTHAGTQPIYDCKFCGKRVAKNDVTE